MKESSSDGIQDDYELAIINTAWHGFPYQITLPRDLTLAYPQNLLFVDHRLSSGNTADDMDPFRRRSRER
jgi:hypothetical protein